MLTFDLPPTIWLFLASLTLLFGFIAFSLGYPGGGKVKTTLLSFTSFWGLFVFFQMIGFMYEASQLQAPNWLYFASSVSGYSMGYSVVLFYYAVLERKRDWFLNAITVYCLSCFVLALINEDMYLLDSHRGMVGLTFGLFGWGGSLLLLIKGYREARPNSSRKKRIFLVLLSIVINIFIIWFPIQVLATDLFGFFENRMLATGIVVFLDVVGLIVLFMPMITRYNLVKVQLDQVGEGLFRDIDAPVVLLSNDQAILRVNPKAEELFFMEEVMTKPEKERSVALIIPNFKKDDGRFDIVLETKKGSREFECTLSRVYQMDEVLGGILIFHDVTRERELARTKSEFTSTVSHELRTPLTSILGFAKIIDRRFKNVILPNFRPETKKEERAIKQVNKNVGVIISESNRLTSLINDILDISKIEAGKVDWNFAKCSPIGFIEQAINATNGLFTNKPSLQLLQIIPPDLPEVIADSNRVVQVIINLISNAVKFTDSGTITIEVKPEWSSLIIKVIDTGDGISEENQKLVFDKYKQVGEVNTEKPKGTGLGLPISKEIVEYHGGRIWVESKEGEGSTFAFTLPLANVVNSSSTFGLEDLRPHLENLNEKVTNEKPTVLLIDDEAPIREVLNQILEDAGYSSIEANDGVEGLELARAHLPDLIILDVMMPRLNGFDCAAALKADAACRNIPILMLTVIKDEQRAYGLGVESYLTKPFEAADVLQAVKELTQLHSKPKHVILLADDDASQVVGRLLDEYKLPWSPVKTIVELESHLATAVPNFFIVTNDFAFADEQQRSIEEIIGLASSSVYRVDTTL